MKDIKTTISGLVAGVAVIVKTLGFEIPDEVLDGIIAVAVFALGWFAKQAD
jgi:hypothetical protein